MVRSVGLSIELGNLEAALPMESLTIILILTATLVFYGVIEYIRHQRFLQSIPIRIHVNGTRGKSSVTRLIGAGLRAGGYNTITKVTGTFPRMILSDGTEVVVPRKEKANILEQLAIVQYCAQRKADVLLIECMALQPTYQRITEHQMIKATHGVLTNIRMDHLDVMGPRLENVAEALSLTIPKKSKLFTAEDRLTDFLEKKAQKLKTELVIAQKDMVDPLEMEGFTYFEHPENVALALALCNSLKIDRTMALEAMKKTIPDEGALRRYRYLYQDHQIHFYNALAANDPESSMMIWNNIRKMEGENKQYVVVLNSRKDRKERSEQLIHSTSKLKFDLLVLSGENVELVRAMALKKEIPNRQIVMVGQKEPEQQIADIFPQINKDAVIVAFGNMGAGGAELSKYFEENHQIQ